MQGQQSFCIVFSSFLVSPARLMSAREYPLLVLTPFLLLLPPLLLLVVLSFQDIEPFTKPKVQLEQYPTGADIASRMLYTVGQAQQQQQSGQQLVPWS